MNKILYFFLARKIDTVLHEIKKKTRTLFNKKSRFIFKGNNYTIFFSNILDSKSNECLKFKGYNFL